MLRAKQPFLAIQNTTSGGVIVKVERYKLAASLSDLFSSLCLFKSIEANKQVSNVCSLKSCCENGDRATVIPFL